MEHIKFLNRSIIFLKGCVFMYQNKPGSNNPLQKGKRRQKLHDEQNNQREPEKKTSYTNDK